MNIIQKNSFKLIISSQEFQTYFDLMLKYRNTAKEEGFIITNLENSGQLRFRLMTGRDHRASVEYYPMNRTLVLNFTQAYALALIDELKKLEEGMMKEYYVETHKAGITELEIYTEGKKR